MPKNLLLADDSKTIQQAVGMTFAGEDLSVVVVDDGEAALQAAKQSKPDLILADISMPRLGGYELCQRVRADAALKDVPVLLLGGPTPIDPAKAMAVGANGHMPKPFDSAKLIEHVKTILANPKAKPAIAVSAPARPGVPPARPSGPPAPAKPAVSPGAAGTTMVMARPPAPSGAAPKPISTPNPARPSAPPPPRPGTSAPPTTAARPPAPPARPPAAPASRPPAPQGAQPSTPPSRAAPPPRPPPPAARPPPPAFDEEEDIPLDV